MHSVSIPRNTFLGALAALSLFAAALLIHAPQASASLSQCPESAVCIWENNNFTGEFSFWSGSEEGCHNHVKNPKIRSGEDRTLKNVRFGGYTTLHPLEPPFKTTFQEPAGENPVTGEICWPV
jgi:hypothetical protein